MSTDACKRQLVRMTRDLGLKWKQTRVHWRDAKGLEFEERFMDELTAGVRSATEAMGRIDRLMRKIRLDCE
jgi:hypothetical protein